MWISGANLFSAKKKKIFERIFLPYKPIKLDFFDDKNPKQFFSGPSHHGVITEDGNLYTFGKGDKGKLGHGNYDEVSYKDPQLVSYFAKNYIKVKKISFGESHSMALSEDGDLYTWGYGGTMRAIFSFYKGNFY